MTRISWKRLLVVAGLLLLLTFLLLSSRNPDAGLRERMYEALHAFEVHDAELNRDVLLARAGLLPHYDSLSEEMDGLHDALATWNRGTNGLRGARRRHRRHVANLSQAVRDKETLLEYFKADNALLRNSLTYFLHTGHILSTQTAANDRAVASAIGTLSNAMLRFVRTPQRAVSGEIRTALNHMTSGPLFRRDLHTLALHGHLIVDVLPEVDDLMRDLLAAPTTAQVRTLREASLQHYSRMEARAQTHRILLYLVAVVLLAYLVYLFNRLRANARDLARANTSLRHEMDERTRLEEKAREQELQLIQANKMTALGTLVAGVAHEINNPNNLTMMNARAVAEAWGDAQPILEDYHQENGEFLIGGLPYAENAGNGARPDSRYARRRAAHRAHRKQPEGFRAAPAAGRAGDPAGQRGGAACGEPVAASYRADGRSAGSPHRGSAAVAGRRTADRTGGGQISSPMPWRRCRKRAGRWPCQRGIIRPTASSRSRSGTQAWASHRKMSSVCATRSSRPNRNGAALALASPSLTRWCATTAAIWHSSRRPQRARGRGSRCRAWLRHRPRKPCRFS